MRAGQAAPGRPPRWQAQFQEDSGCARGTDEAFAWLGILPRTASQEPLLPKGTSSDQFRET